MTPLHPPGPAARGPAPRCTDDPKRANTWSQALERWRLIVGLHKTSHARERHRKKNDGTQTPRTFACTSAAPNRRRCSGRSGAIVSLRFGSHGKKKRQKHHDNSQASTTQVHQQRIGVSCRSRTGSRLPFLNTLILSPGPMEVRTSNTTWMAEDDNGTWTIGGEINTQLSRSSTRAHRL